MLQREKRSLIIFGCGYLGGALARRALQDGCDVTAVTRNQNQAACMKNLGATVVLAEIENNQWRDSIPPAFDCSVLCAGAGGGGVEAYRRSYLEANRRIVDWAGEGRIKQHLFTSSTSVYAQNSGETVVESDRAEGSSPGAKVLLEAEEVVANSSCFDRWFVLRLGGLYGPGRSQLIERVRRGDAAAEPDRPSVLNLIRVEDAVGAIESAFASDPGTNGVFNIVDDAPAPRAEVIAWMSEELERRGLLVDADESGFSRVRRRGRNRYVSNRKARTLLNWRPLYADFRAGYGELIDSISP